MDNNNPIISVIMAVKNGEEYIQKSVESIQNQTLNDIELIVCDDGSTDRTLEILQKLAVKYGNMTILHNEVSKGSAQARNRCIDIARSNIIAVHDADDFSALNRFELQYAYMQQHPEYAIVGTGYYATSKDGTVLGECHPLKELTARNQAKGGSFMHPSFMMRKDKLEKVGFYTVSPHTLRSQDYHMVMKVLGAGMRIYNMEDCLYYYTVDDGMMNRTRNWKRVKGLMWIRWDAYRRNHLPIWYYIYIFKPLLTNLLPQKLMFKHYRNYFGGAEEKPKKQ